VRRRWLPLIGLLLGAALLYVLRTGGAAPNTQLSDLREGGLYSLNEGDGAFRVAKILVLEPNVVHIRVYKERFNALPQDVDPAQLTLGSMRDPDGFGMGHLPMAPNAFLASRPVFLRQETVTPEELEGYEVWKDAGGGVFGP
jgi:hypothetical protein